MAQSLNQTPRQVVTQNTTRCKEKIRLTPIAASSPRENERDIISDFEEISVRIPSEFQNRDSKNLQIELKTVEEYCKEENVFFNVKDKTRYTIEKSVSLFNEFRECMQKSFQHVEIREEVPNLRTMMMTQAEFQERANVTPGFNLETKSPNKG